jgi:SPP1 family predicted phage head-tail adaptor
MSTLGSLTQRIVISARTVTQDPLGGEIVAWVPVHAINANVRYGSGSEAMRQNGITANTMASFRVLNRKGLEPRQRITYNGQVWNIDDIRPDSERRYTDLVCTQGVNDG